MIVVKVPSFGLGNQLFLYAFTRYLADKYKKKLFVYFPRKMQHNAGYAKCLGMYHLRIDKVLNKWEFLYLSGRQVFIYYFGCIVCKIFNRPQNVHIEMEHRYEQGLNKLGIITNFDISNWDPNFGKYWDKKLFIMGYFQVPYYAEQLKEYLKKELVPKFVKSEDSIFLEKLHDLNSVCVHIRRGDYINSKIHYVCDATYYQKAISKMEQLLQNPNFYIFTDDVNMVLQEMNFLVKDNIVVINKEVNELDEDNPSKDLYFMSQCQNFIISNSSFSWWAQFLSTNNTKKVIAPLKWYSDDNMEGKLYQEGWEYLE